MNAYVLMCKIVVVVEAGVLRVNPLHNDSLAWLGDTALEAFLGLLGVDAGLKAWTNCVSLFYCRYESQRA